MKRILSWTLSLAMAISLAACGGTSGSSSTAASAAPSGTAEGGDLSGQTVSMVIWGSDDRKSAYEELFADFTAETGINVEITLVELESIITKTSAQIAAGDSYDMVWMSEAMIPQMMNNGLLEDMGSVRDDADYDYADLSQSLQANYEGPNGEVYAISFTSSPRVWFYNKDLIEQTGLEDPLTLAKNGEWTYEKLFEYSQAVKDLNNGSYGFSIWNYQSPNDWNILLDWTWSNGASFFNEDMTECTINTPEGIAALNSYKDCIDQGLTPTADSSLDFASGQIAFSRNTISQSGTLGDVDFKWDVLPNPKGTDEDAPVAVGVAAYVVPKGAPHKEAAIEAIKYITSKEMMADDYLMSNFSPVRASVLGSDKYLDQGEAPSKAALELSILEPMTGNTRIYPTCDNYDECDLKVKELLSAWYAGQYTTEELVGEMETQCNTIIQQ